MSTNVCNPQELKRVLDAVGVAPSLDGVGYVILGKAESGKRKAETDFAGGPYVATRQNADLNTGHTEAGAPSAINFEFVQNNGQIGPVVNVSADEPPLHHRPTFSAGCIPGPGASPNGGENYSSAAPVGFARNRRRHTLARWLSVSPQLRRME